MIKWQGTAYRLHPLFSLLMLASVLTGYFLEAVTLFGIVLIHELGHVAAAKSFGWRVAKVELLPFGGVAVVEELGSVPAREELIVSLSGPAQHIWMIGFASLWKIVSGDDNAWWDYFIEANIMIGLFNLMPILPLDGGKVMQCILSYLMPYHRSILIGARISISLSIVVIAAAIYRLANGQLPVNILLIGLFLLISNWQSYKQLPYHFYRFLINRGGRVSRLLVQGTLAQPIVVTKQRAIAEIMKLFMRERYHLIYVVNEKGHIDAVLPEQQLVVGYLNGIKPGSKVSELLN